MNTRIFNSRKELIIHGLRNTAQELDLNCKSPYQLRYIVHTYLEPYLGDIKMILESIENE